MTMKGNYSPNKSQWKKNFPWVSKPRKCPVCRDTPPQGTWFLDPWDINTEKCVCDNDNCAQDDQRSAHTCTVVRVNSSMHMSPSCSGPYTAESGSNKEMNQREKSCRGDLMLTPHLSGEAKWSRRKWELEEIQGCQHGSDVDECIFVKQGKFWRAWVLQLIWIWMPQSKSESRR